MKIISKLFWLIYMTLWTVFYVIGLVLSPIIDGLQEGVRDGYNLFAKTENKNQ